ncbi:MAG: hypothetical protein M3Y54_02510 [Bacteroidota bacterium]|nr:hypothetical protein [Bacteroidota bacterium]
MNRIFRSLAALSLLLAAAACSPTTDTAKEATPAAADTPATPPAATETPAASANMGTVHVVIAGGKHAGTYDAVMHDGGASYGMAGEHVFGNQYSESDKKPNELSSVQLTVDNVTGDKTTTSGFTVSMAFGSLLGGDALNINTEPDASRPTGKGQVNLKYGGGKGPATVKLSGETAAHEKIDLTIDAPEVTTAQ